MSAISLERESLRIVHRIEVVHGGTGRPWEDFEARLLAPAWSRWRLRRRGANCILSTLERFAGEEPAQTRVEIILSRPELRERFVAAGVKTVVLNQGGDAVVTAVLDPVPVELEVILLKSNGSASADQNVQARGNGHTVALPAIASGSNVYRSAPTVWDPAGQPYRILVNDTQRGFASLDFSQQVTRVRVIEP